MSRIIIKMSGEALANKNKKLAIDPITVNEMAEQVKEILKTGTQVGIVVGGGNFWRGATAEKNGIPRNRADYIGMLATVMNGLALQSSFEQVGISAKVQTAINIDQRVAEYYVNEKALNSLNKGEVLIFAGGTGRPYFTTDTAATLLASELKATTILMGKNGVDGIYDSDPKINKDAKRFETISYDEILERGLAVMDATATSMAKTNNIELLVFDIKEENSLLRALNGDINLTRVVREK